jgi:hypothetical protein
VGALLLGVGGWHFICTEKLEASIQEYIEPYWDDADFDANLDIRIHPLSNLVSINFVVQAEGADDIEHSEQLLIDALLVAIRNEVEPVIERELSLAARKQFDLYAIALPYRTAISLDFSTKL